MIVDPVLRALWAAAYLRGLEVRVHDSGDVVVVSTRARASRADDTGEGVVVPLRPNGGDSRPHPCYCLAGDPCEHHA